MSVILEAIKGTGLAIEYIENNPVESKWCLKKKGYKYFPQGDVGVQHVKI